MKKSVRIAAMIFTIFAILIAVEIIISYKCLTVTDYKIKSDKIKETTKIVLISDLHNSQFGSKNKRLVDKIQKQDVYDNFMARWRSYLDGWRYVE